MVKKINNLTAVVAALAEPIIAGLDAELVEVEWQKEAGQWVLRIYIDRQSTAVDHDLCEKVSRALSDVLDETDPIEQSYVLEVSSPGIERPLKKPADYSRFAGEEVLVKLFAPVSGKKEYQGTLLGINGDSVMVRTGEGEISFTLSQIAKAHLVVEF